MTPPSLFHRPPLVRDLGGRYAHAETQGPRPARGVKVQTHRPSLVLNKAATLVKEALQPFAPLGTAQAAVAHLAAGIPGLEQAFLQSAPWHPQTALAGLPTEELQTTDQLPPVPNILLYMQHPQTAAAARMFYDRATNFRQRHGLRPLQIGPTNVQSRGNRGF